MKISHERLKKLIQAIFVGMGCEPAEAERISHHLVQANLAGHDSHGVIRTQPYFGWLREEKVFANRKIEILVDTGTMAVVDGQLGFGQSIGQQTINLAIEKCREHGVAITALRNSSHLGRIGHWAEMTIDAGFISIHFVSSTGLGMYVVPFGGKDRRLSLNPIAVGIPVDGGDSLVLDIAAAMTAEGKLKVARNKSERVPDGWIVDAEGRPTNDPNLFYGPPLGAVLPFGGHKGYGLALVAELLVGALTGGGCSRAGVTLLEQGMLSVLIDPLRLQSPETLFGELRRYIEFLKSARPVSPNGEILIPGDVERRHRAERTRDGIDVDERTWSQIVATAHEVQVSDELIQETLERAD